MHSTHWLNLTRGLRTTEIFLNFLLYYPAKKQGKFSRKIQNIILLLWIFPLWICCLQDNRAGISNYILSFFTLFYKAYIHLLHIILLTESFFWRIFFQFQVRIIGTIFPILEHCAPFPPSILWNRKSKKEDVSSIISLNSRNTQPRYQSQDFQIAKSTLSRNIVGRLMRKKLCSWYRIGQNLNVDLYYKIFS